MKLLARIVAVVVVLIAIVYVGIVGYMYVNQRALQYDPSGPVLALSDTKLSVATEVTIASGDGSVHGWYQPPSPGKPLIVYYKGNSRSFTEEHERYEQFVADGYGFLAFDYRGFPASPGQLNEANILADALAAFEWAAAKGSPLVIWGRSLGTGPATYVASQKDARALLLETPFLSAVAVAAERYPILPVALVMQDQFRSDEWIKSVTEPIFVAHGTADQTISVSNGERLYALAPNKDDLWIVEGADHSDLWAAGIWPRADAFFQRAMK